MFAKWNRARVLALGCAVVFAAVLPLSTGAQTLDEKQLIEQLLGKASRSASGPGTAAPKPVRELSPAETARLRELLARAGSRAFTAKERVEVAELVRDRPSVDFEIYFPFNSATVQRAAHETMQKVGQILANEAFRDRAFLIAGHTDAKGSAKANQFVSQRRAEAVKAFLVKHYGIAPSRLRTIGHGKEQLKDVGQPFAEINRRVQIINLPDGTVTASR